MRKSIFFFILFSTTLFARTMGQDPHFSQYFSSPLTLNPAMGGYFNGDYRISTNYRQQWRAIGEPYTTGTASYDGKVLINKIPNNDVAAIGILGLYDQSLGGAFKSINLSASIAYHKALDADGIHNLGLGFQGTYVSRSINFNNLDYANQFDGSGFDTDLPSFENFGSTVSDYFDFNTGLLYTYKTENTEIYFGGSLYHITRPNTSFVRQEKFELPVRYTIHAGSRFVVSNSGNELFIGGLYMNQAGATEKNIGMAYGIKLANETKIYAGSWYRFEDAFIPFAGLSHKSFELGLSYDITNSSLKNYYSRNSSFELSMNLLIKKPRNVYTNYKGGRIF